MKGSPERVATLRQISLKHNPLFFNAEHERRQAKILSTIKKISAVSISNLEKRQCSNISVEDRLVIMKNKGKNFCVIAIYVKGSNVRLEMNCNSSTLEDFKKVQVREIRKLEGLWCK